MNRIDFYVINWCLIHAQIHLLRAKEIDEKTAKKLKDEK
jgi:hypothetical protein